MNLLLESLQQLGFTSYEAKVIVALTHYGNRTVAEIHNLSGIPRSAVYGVLTKLNNKGIIETQNTKPMKYKAVEPEIIIDKLTSNYQKAATFALAELEKLSLSKDIVTSEEGSWNISGVRNVHDKIIQLIESAEKEIMFASTFTSLSNTPKTSNIRQSIIQAVKTKMLEGIRVRITAKDNSCIVRLAKNLPESKIRVYQHKNTKTPLKGGILIVDDKEVLIISIKDDIMPVNLNATWYNAEEQISVFKHFVEIEWETSQPLN